MTMPRFFIHPDATQAQGEFDQGFCYEGPFGQTVTDHLLKWVEHVLDTIETPKPNRKRAFRCAVEVIQNVSKHASSGAFFVAKQFDSTLLIGSSNEVDEAQRLTLEKSLVEARALPFEELRTQRLQKLEHGSRTEKGGAGLGFLDLRVCSHDHVYTEFIPCTADSARFLLTVEISLKS